MDFIGSELIELTARLVRLRSDNPGACEGAVIDELERLLSAAGIVTRRVEARPGRDCLLARIDGAEAQPALMFSGHADTVPVDEEEARHWHVDPFGGQLADGRIYGRGSTDMKGGLAAITAAMIELRRRRIVPRRPLVLAVTVDEEWMMAGSHALLGDAWIAESEYALIAEPTDLCLAAESWGRTFGTFFVRGKSAHGAVPAAGDNAIVKTMQLLARLLAQDLTARLGAEAHWQPLAIEAGSDPGIVPDFCRFTLDARIGRGIRPDDVWALVDEIVAAGPFDTIDYVVDDRRVPWRTDETNAFRRAVEREAEALGLPSEPIVFRGSTDANIFREAGITPLIIGPGNLALAHAADEYVDVDALRRAARLYFNLMQSF